MLVSESLSFFRIEFKVLNLSLLVSSLSANLTNENTLERTFILLKPDSVHRGLVGKIIERFEDKGFKLVALKFVQVSYSL